MSPPNNAIAGESKPLAARATPAMNIALFTGRVSHASGRPSKEQLPPMGELAALPFRSVALHTVRMNLSLGQSFERAFPAICGILLLRLIPRLCCAAPLVRYLI